MNATGMRRVKARQVCIGDDIGQFRVTSVTWVNALTRDADAPSRVRIVAARIDRTARGTNMETVYTADPEAIFAVWR